MLCSEKELGISDDHSGIMEFPPSTALDQNFAKALGLDDVLIEVDLTPNRPDCASVIGIAREIAGIMGKKIKPPDISHSVEPEDPEIEFSVKIDAPEDCPRYAAKLLKNITIAPSPWWLQRRLTIVGLRPINNIVDITNLVMLEYGQPLHAFDYHEISDGKIVVRRAEEGEKFTTLDGNERELDSEMLLICDGKRPVAVAGVMGGLNSEVSDSTTEVLLESACFNPVSIRRTARKLKMGTDASYRFERGVDPGGTRNAMERAIQLMVDIAGATPAPGVVDNCVGIQPPPILNLRVQRTCDLLGMSFSSEEIADKLRSIEMKVEIKDAETLLVEPPSFRVDIEREIDLVEEIARLVGFNNIPSTLPIVPMSFPETSRARELRHRIASLLVSQGFSEAVNYSFISEKHFDKLNLSEDHRSRKTVKLLNPLTEDQAAMRTMLLPGLLENVLRNVNRQVTEIRLFETGKIFLPQYGSSETAAQPHEETHVAGVLSGRRNPDSSVLYFGTSVSDMYDVKGAVENILRELRLNDIIFKAVDSSEAAVSYAEGGTLLELSSDDLVLGYLGKADTDVLKAFGIRQDVFFFDLNLDAMAVLTAKPKEFSPLPKYPAVRWDIAMLVPENAAVGDILQAVSGCGEKLVENVEIFDVYRGKSIENEKKSVALSVTYRSEKETLDDSMVDAVHQRIIKLIEEKFNGSLREASE
jgi:phenylalanyl-tRNA synthetase beta chain